MVRLGAGKVVPYPAPSSPAATAVGLANRRKDTKPEIALRSALHRRGHRFRKDLYFRLPDVRVHIDIAFTRRRVAVFVDGCFWHSCPAHGTEPKSNTAYWAPKLRANVDRDARATAALEADGWTVLRIWEHTSSEEAVKLVEEVLALAVTDR